MWRDFNPQSLFIEVLAAFVGFASSFAVVLQGLKAVGASDAQAASGLMAAAVVMGLCGIFLSNAGNNAKRKNGAANVIEKASPPKIR